jgi:hypothetical protein
MAAENCYYCEQSFHSLASLHTHMASHVKAEIALNQTIFITQEERIKNVQRIRGAIKEALLHRKTTSSGIKVNCCANLEMKEDEFLTLFGSLQLKCRRSYRGNLSYVCQLTGSVIDQKMTDILGLDWETAQRPGSNIFFYVLTTDFRNKLNYKFNIKFTKKTLHVIETRAKGEQKQIIGYETCKVLFTFQKDCSTQ